MSENDLVEAMIGTINSDSDAFQILYKATRRRVYLACFRVCRNHEVAEDLSADVFRTVWQKAHLWREGVGSVEAWVGTIARNRAVDWRRQQGDTLPTALAHYDMVADDTPLIDAVLIRAEEYASMRLALQGLPINQRAAIEAAFFGDTTYVALAREFDVPIGTMKAWIRRGLAKLRAQLSLSQRS
jgi:RNA polymerase sigma factor (sigma-70 family)